MTREEAKRRMEICRDFLANNYSDMGEPNFTAFEMAIQALSQEPKVLNTIDFAIDASNGDTNYFVGFRNGLRYAKSLIDGEEPQFESCAEQEPCDDAISREWLKTAIHNFYYGLKHTPTEEDIQAYIDVAPSVTQKSEKWIDGVHAMGYREGYKDAQKQKLGHWIHFAQSDDCSECGWSTGKYISPSNYCPNCGAKMVKPQESEGKE